MESRQLTKRRAAGQRHLEILGILNVDVKNFHLSEIVILSTLNPRLASHEEPAVGQMNEPTQITDATKRYAPPAS